MPKKRKKERITAVALLFCMGLVGLWLILAARARSEFDSFRLTGEQLADFHPVSVDWYAERLHLVADDPLEPNIVAHNLRLRYPNKDFSHQPVFVRLVHGYNMCDCMRIKGYEVELLKDHRPGPGIRGQGTGGREHLASNAQGNTTEYGLQTAAFSEERLTINSLNELPLLQVWRLTSSNGDISLWVTSMLRASDFVATGIDVRDMAFPRVGVPDAQGWAPRGFSIKGLRHPIRNTRLFLRAKWNASRCDLLTFLGLRRPAWASDEMLTLVSAVNLQNGDDEAALSKHVLKAHALMLHEYGRWRRKNPVE